MNRANSPLLLLLVAALGPAANSWSQSSFVNFEATQTNPVRLSPDGRRLFAVNTPDARLSVFDVSSPANPVLIAEIPVGLEPVSVNPLNSGEAWVINEVSDSVSIVSVSRHLVTRFLETMRSALLTSRTIRSSPSSRCSAKSRARSQSARTGRKFMPCSLSQEIVRRSSRLARRHHSRLP